jgi:hypothetical protein
MKFHTNSNFVKHDLHNGTLWLAGWCDHPLGKLNYMFADHDIPDLRGQFGLVWQGHDGWWLAQCDHLCTYPLWYSNNGEHVYSLWEQATQNDRQSDEVFFAMRDLLYGQMTVGTRTARQETKRIQPDHCLDRGTQVRYRHSIDVTTDGPPESEWADRLHTAIKRNCSDGDVLFLSGGRDSTTIANVAHHAGIKLDYVHVTRGKDNPDTRSCREFASNIGIQVNYLDPWKSSPDYREGDYWHDSSYAPKRECLRMLGKTHGVSGELGASESGSKKINTILQRPDITVEQLTNIWMTTLEARNESVANPVIHADYTESHMENRFWKQAYTEIIQYFDDMYAELAAQTNDNHQLLKAAIMMHQQDHEVYRLHNYSQDTEMNWRHPFTDPDWCDIIWNAPLERRKLHYHNREVYRIAATNWSWFDTTAWKYGGPRGLKQ